jgi:formate hydrogenlyase subunit 6/NADH:ubiquinone oxidoreductase subunit I
VEPVFAAEVLALKRTCLQSLLDAVIARGFRLVGPTLRDAAIVYDDIRRVEDLPVGWTDAQEAGTYRVRRRDDAAVFGYVVGPHSWKKYLFPPRSLIWKASRQEGGFRFEAVAAAEPPLALLGVRSCELHAIAVQDRVFHAVDPAYRARRDALLIIAVQCGQAAPTCFCGSMQTGPRAAGGFDLALTEVLAPGAHSFLVEIGSPRGAALMADVPHEPASESLLRAAQAATERARAQLGRTLDTRDIKDLLYRNYDSPHWNDVASRCLTCANCTLACPTCFCSTVEDTADLSGEHAERWRRWDSCFNLEFSHVHGGNARPTPAARYRQWLTHKLATWIDQFGTSGCVGCGRCITWCPVGIDLTAEVRAIRESEKQHAHDAGHHC